MLDVELSLQVRIAPCVIWLVLVYFRINKCGIFSDITCEVVWLTERIQDCPRVVIFPPSPSALVIVYFKLFLNIAS